MPESEASNCRWMKQLDLRRQAALEVETGEGTRGFSASFGPRGKKSASQTNKCSTATRVGCVCGDVCYGHDRRTSPKRALLGGKMTADAALGNFTRARAAAAHPVKKCRFTSEKYQPVAGKNVAFLIDFGSRDLQNRCHKVPRRSYTACLRGIGPRAMAKLS